MSRKSLTILATLGCLLALGRSAHAELIVLSAVDFVKRCIVECTVPNGDENVIDRGVLKPNDGGRFFASVSFPVNGQRVCSFALVYHDINANDPLTAKLIRKRFVLGADAFNNPIVMASVASAAGVTDAARRVTTTAINQPVIQKGNSFYYVEVFAKTINLDFLGVQIDVRPTCPS